MLPKLLLRGPTGIESQTKSQVARTLQTSEAEVWVPEAAQCYVKVKVLGEGVMRSQLSHFLSPSHLCNYAVTVSAFPA